MPLKHLAVACRVPELVALLDGETSFPAGPFDNEDALVALTRLGMRASIAPESILQSAQYIAELGLQNPHLAHERYLCICALSLLAGSASDRV